MVCELWYVEGIIFTSLAVQGNTEEKVIFHWKKRRCPSHEVVEEILISVLVVAGLQILIREHVIICMIFLPLELFILLLLLLFLRTLFIPGLAVTALLLLCVLFLLSLEIREFLDSGLVQTVDDWVLTLLDIDLADQLVIMECDLTGRH